MIDEKAIALFIGATDTNRATAIRFLSKCDNKVDEAVEAFLSSEKASAVGADGRGQQHRRNRGGSSSLVRGLGDLHGQDGGQSDSNDYYVGGGKSGQLVHGAPDADDRSSVERLFERVRQSGAQVGSLADLEEGENAHFRSFQGRSNTLSGVSEEYEGQPEERNVTVTFYANRVFTVDGGEPRNLEDPANAQFIRYIMNGHVPPEILSIDPMAPVNINLVRRGEDYVPPAKPKYRAFEGDGHSLVAPSTDNDEGNKLDKGSDVESGDWKGPDASLPTTSIQIRLADGGRLVAKFNLTQTIMDIRQFLKASRADLPKNFRLLTSFPTKDLTDVSQTIEEAGIGGSVLFQK